jgi:hypothetical protein
MASQLLCLTITAIQRLIVAHCLKAVFFMVLVMKSKNVTGVQAWKKLISSLSEALKLLLSLLEFDHGRLPGSH